MKKKRGQRTIKVLRMRRTREQQGNRTMDEARVRSCKVDIKALSSIFKAILVWNIYLYIVQFPKRRKY